jgi:integrase
MELRAAFQCIAWGAFGLTRQRWANVCSDTRRAIRVCGFENAPKLSRIPLSSAWEMVVSTIQHPIAKSMICRLGRYCSGLQIAPEMVDDKVLESFFQNLGNVQFSKEPERITRDTIRVWNKSVYPVGGYQRLSSRSSRDYYGLTWEAFPPSFLEDAKNLRKRSLNANFTDDDIRKVRPATANQRHRQLRRLASAEVLGGVSPCGIIDLCALVQPENLKMGVQFLLSRNDDKPNQQMYDLLILAQTIAVHWVKLDPDKVAEIRKWAKKIKPKKFGMTERNRERLEPLKDPDIWQRLYDLPRRLAAAALATPPSYATAMKLQAAISIGILLNAPIRLQNLRTLDWHRHFTKRHTKCGRVLFLCLPAREVKNDQDIELPLPAWLEKAIERYVVEHLPLITNQMDTAYLIPGPTGVPKSESGTRSLIMRTIRRELGLIINPHLFRHLAAYTFLCANPGHYETVRKLLGHKNIQTTINFYIGLEDEAAIAMFGALIEKISNGTPS